MNPESENKNTAAAKITLVLGGARSGKSALAEKLAERRAGENVLYVATLQPYDQEMRERVVRHRASRPAAWRTVEAPYRLAVNIFPSLDGRQVVLLDCLTVWLGNLIVRESGLESSEAQAPSGEIYDDQPASGLKTAPLEPDREEDITSDLQDSWGATKASHARPEPDYTQLEANAMAELERLIEELRQRNIGLIMVSNEVGMGLVPPYPMGRAYRDILGRLNQKLAQMADEAYMVLAGIPVELKKLSGEL